MSDPVKPPVGEYDPWETPVGTVVLDYLIAVGYVRRRGVSLEAAFHGHLASREASVEIHPQYETAPEGLEGRELAWILWHPHIEPRRSLLERTLSGSADIVFKRSFSNRGWWRPNPTSYSLSGPRDRDPGEGDRGPRARRDRRHPRAGREAVGRGGTTT